MTRADWLARAIVRLEPLAHRRHWPTSIGASCAPMIHVAPTSVGESWMETRALGRINIAPSLAVPEEVLAVLLHELLHLSVGPHRLHSNPFRHAARRAGFVPPYTHAVPSPGLAADLRWVALTLGPYPSETFAEPATPKGSATVRSAAS